jgi:hypothetical protein
MAEHRVTVWDRIYTVDVHKTSKSVWRAVGEYEGEHIETQDRSETTALKRWREAARYRGNG